ncbi:MAG: PDZ domain-containing protein [Desulfovibrio sp.]
MTVTLEERAENVAKAQNGQPESKVEPATKLGVFLRPLQESEAKQLGLEAARGLLVTNVQPGSPAASQGLSRGDVILEVNQTAVDSVDEFLKAVDAAGNRPALLLVRRGTRNFFVTVPVATE